MKMKLKPALSTFNRRISLRLMKLMLTLLVEVMKNLKKSKKVEEEMERGVQLGKVSKL